uniref:Mediator of RNA polymerase II transcription subunit 13 n=1 Tax=Kwoniella dejecticola CBS 10117 TaxID=1296121 RepID=A0A1A5ZZR0_9TREE|nr:uncharacterized protein I303_06846 [Kwoniella dejecticola CBS 10117]OBR83283.1 hypothetical protein I303_06846 [Kwoniella dejecticola CBS 10117]
MIDFLGGEPPRPTTIIPNQWIIDLPAPDTQIHIRQYRAPPENGQVSAGPSTSTPSSSSIFRDVLVDPFERAWRLINDHPDNNEIPAIHNALSRPCAVIANEGGEKMLYHFSNAGAGHSEGESEVPAYEGLEEITPAPQLLSITQLVSCSQHGHDPSCLDPKPLDTGAISTCKVSLDLSGGVSRHLELLASALVEKIAWQQGKGSRLLTQSSFTSSYTSFNSSLRPISSQRFLLSVNPPRQPSSSTTHTPTPLLLSPLNLPALLLCPSSLTSTQESHLISSFDSAFGHTWKEGRSERRTRSLMLGESYSDWSIYWVPLDSIEKWQSFQGVLTIWPTHLSHPYFLCSASTIRRPIARPHTDATTHTDLLGISAGLFDFMSTYKEPDPPPDGDGDGDGEDEDEEEDVNMDAESTVITAEADSDQILQQANLPEVNEVESDLDDLFSAHSDSPNVTIIPDQVLDQPILSMMDTDPPIESLDGYITSMPITSSGDNNRQLSRNGTENGQKEEMVTEDDFAFFDSPTDAVDISTDPNDVSAEMTQKNPTIDDHTMAIDGSLPPRNEWATLNPPVSDASDTKDAASEEQPLEMIVQDQATEEALQAAVNGKKIAVAEKQQNLPTTLIASPPPTAIPKLPSPPTPSPPPTELPSSWLTTDLIPPTFSPLPLLPLSDSPFPYSLPTPAPTPSSLNWDLVERLQPPKSNKPTYADDWNMEDEQSDLDEEDPYTDPPTPITDYTTDSEEEITCNQKAKAQPNDIAEGHDHEIESSGARCVGAEWLHLVYELAKLNDIAQLWNSSWIKAHEVLPILPPTPPEEVSRKNWLKGLDVGRFVKQILGNTNMRSSSLCLRLGSSSLSQTSTWAALVEKNCMTLADLSHDVKTRPLPQPQISAGYHHYSINLNISSLQYWTELGLQPHGGHKDVKAVFLCDDSPGSTQRAASAGAEIGRAWRELHFGSHELADDAIISAKSTVMVEAAANVLNQSPDDTVLYIVLPHNPPTKLIRGLFNYAISPAPSTVVHLLPQHSLTASQYKTVASEVYNKVSESIREINARSVPDPYGLHHSSSDSDSHENDDRIARQAFTLARSENPTPEFSMSWPLKSYDVLNNNRFIHSAYTVDEDLGIMIGFMMDDLGNMSDVNTWTDIAKMKWENRVEKLWKWAKAKADKWVIQWRLSVMRCGGMVNDELKAWRKILQDGNLPITLLLTAGLESEEASDANEDEDIPRPKGFTNIPPATLNDPSSSIIDLAHAAQLTILGNKLPIDLIASSASPATSTSTSTSTASQEVIYPISSFLLTLSQSQGSESQTTLYNVIHHQEPPSNPVGPWFASTTTKKKDGKESDDAVKLENELGEEIYRIGCLIFAKWGIRGGIKGVLGMAVKELKVLSLSEME